MKITRAGTIPSKPGPEDYFTGRVRLDPLILPMINRPQIQRGLQCPEGPFHSEELLVA